MRRSTMPTRLDVMIERAVMEEVGGGCSHRRIYCRGGDLIAEVLALDGSRRERRAARRDAQEAGVRAGPAREGGLIREAYAALGLRS